MKSANTFRINTPAVVSEVFDDEIVVLHLEKGTYYSLAESSAEIWKLLQHGSNIPEISRRLAETYTVGSHEATAAVQSFVAELEQEQLIIPDPLGQPMTSGTPHPIFTQPTPTPISTFLPPRLNKYTDMQDLLLLDPIHDVTETGWPRVPVP